MGLSGAAIGTYRPQYRPLSAIRYLDVNPLPTRYTLFISLGPTVAVYLLPIHHGGALGSREGLPPRMQMKMPALPIIVKKSIILPFTI
jgi:hypothetical protein